MPILAPKLQAEMNTRIYNALKKNFASDGATNKEADASWQKTAAAISEIAIDICNLLLIDASVAPGIAVVTTAVGVPPGSPLPAAGATASPGKLI